MNPGKDSQVKTVKKVPTRTPRPAMRREAIWRKNTMEVKQVLQTIGWNEHPLPVQFFVRVRGKN